MHKSAGLRAVRLVPEQIVGRLRIVQDVERVLETVPVRRTRVEPVVGQCLQEGLDVEYDDAGRPWTHSDAEEAGVLETELASYEDSEVVLVVLGENIPAQQEPRFVAAALLSVRETHDALGVAARGFVHGVERGIRPEVRLEVGQGLRTGHGAVCVTCATLRISRSQHTASTQA